MDMANSQAHLAGITAQLQGLALQMQAISTQPTSSTSLTPATSVAGSEVSLSLEGQVDAMSSNVLSLQRDIADIREALGGVQETMAVLDEDLKRRNAE
jgi:prefoldin subunit 5